MFYKGLNVAQTKANPKTAVNDTVWHGDAPTNSVLAPTEVNWGMYRLSFYLQLIQQARTLTTVTMGDGGWDLVTMLYMHDRLLGANRGSDASWDAIKASLGMSTYTSTEARAIDNNSLFLVRASWLLKTDQRPFFDLWGIDYDAKASAQVTAYGFPAAEKRYYYWAYDSAGNPQWADDALGSLPVDGTTRTIPRYPMNYVITPGDTRSIPRGTTVDLMAYVGAAGNVSFNVDGSPISGCSAVATAARTADQPIDSSIHDIVATCRWTVPNSLGPVTLTTVLSPTNPSWLSSTSRTVVVQIAGDATAKPTLTASQTSTVTQTPSTTPTASLTPSVTPTYAGVVASATFTKAPTKTTAPKTATPTSTPSRTAVPATATATPRPATATKAPPTRTATKMPATRTATKVPPSRTRTPIKPPPTKTRTPTKRR
ncbi:MAG: hypothetical protein RLZZ297_1209 [Chloroflexota bacterium]